jgi:SAM-dependent methyltransferase
MSPQSSSAPTPLRIFSTLLGYRQAAALNSAIELGVFSAVAGGATTVQQLAQVCGASERGIEILCNALVAGELLGKSGETYSNTPDTALFLDRKSPAYMGSIAEFLESPDLFKFASTMTDAVRQGHSVGDDSMHHDHPMWVTFAHAMAPLAMPSATAIAQSLPATGPLKVLDIASSHGMYGIMIALRNPEAQIVAVDWKNVVEVGRENAMKMGVGNRYTTLVGSAFEVDLGTGYDAVLLPNFLHHFSPEANTALLRRVHAALKPGGRAITIEFVCNEDRVSPPNSAWFALTMLTNTEAGNAYTYSDLEKMNKDAGYREVSMVLLPTEQGMITAVK